MFKKKLFATRVAAVLLAVITAAPSFAEELLLSDGLSEPVYEEEIPTNQWECLDEPVYEDPGFVTYEEPAPEETPVELLPEEDFFVPETELTDEIVITDEVLPEDELSEELFAEELPGDDVDTTEYVDTYETEDPADTAEDYVADEDMGEDDVADTESPVFDEPVLIEEKFTGDENPTEIIPVVGASDDVNAIFGGISYTRTFNYPNSWTYEAKDTNGVSHTYKLECEPGANVAEMYNIPGYYDPPESCGFKVYCDGELFTGWTQNQYDSNGVKTHYETYRKNHTADAPYGYLEWEIRSTEGTINPDGSFYLPLIGKVRTYLVPIKQPAILTYYAIAGDEIAKDANGNYLPNNNKLVNGVPGIPCVPWTGKPIVPTFVTLLAGGDGVGIYGGVPLTQPSYWPYIDVTYENNTNPGIAKAIFKGKKGTWCENFYSEAPFRIVKEETATPTPAPVTYTYKVTIPQTEYTYTGKEIKPAVTVTWTSSDGRSGTYTKGKDFGVTYTNNINVGTATIKITAMGREGLDGKTLTFKIVAKATPTPTPVSYTYTVSGVNAQYTYTGSAIKPAVTVKANGSTLAASDYTVTYSNNTNVGTATVKVVGKGTHSGLNKTITFKIVKPAVTPTPTPTTNTYTVSGVNASYEYTGKAITPKVIVSANGTQLSTSAYTVTYSNNTNAGTASVKIVGKGIFSDLNKTLTFKIVKNGDSGSVTPTPTPTPTPAKPTVVPPTFVTQSFDHGCGMIRVWYKMRDDVDGYQIRVSPSSTFSYGVNTGSFEGRNNGVRQSAAWTVGTTLYMGVRTYIYKDGKKVYSKWSGTKSLTMKHHLNVPVVKSAKRQSSGKIVATSSVVGAADGYQFAFATNSAFNGEKTLSTKNKKTTLTRSGLPTSNLWVRVRSYKYEGSERYYSEWSKPVYIG